MARNNIYVIPDNFVEGGKVFNGMFKIRNLIEAVVLGMTISIPLLAIPYPTFEVQITVMIGILMPILALAVIGINDDSLVEFLLGLVHWRQNKRIILYNGNARPREIRSADVIEARELPRDKIIAAMDNWKEKRKQAQADVTYIEGIDFTFDDDNDRTSGYIATEKKLIDKKNNVTKQTDNVKKQKKPKTAKKQKTKVNNQKQEILMIDNDLDNDGNIEIDNSAYGNDGDIIIEIDNSVHVASGSTEIIEIIGEDDINVN